MNLETFFLITIHCSKIIFNTINLSNLHYYYHTYYYAYYFNITYITNRYRS